MNFSYKTQRHGDGSPILKLAGELDLESVSRLREELRRLIQEGHSRIIVDLDEMDYLDSSGLGVLVGALARIRESGGELPLVVSEPKHRRLFDVTKLSYVFSLYPNVNAIP